MEALRLPPEPLLDEKQPRSDDAMYEEERKKADGAGNSLELASVSSLDRTSRNDIHDNNSISVTKGHFLRAAERIGLTAEKSEDLWSDLAKGSLSPPQNSPDESRTSTFFKDLAADAAGAGSLMSTWLSQKHVPKCCPRRAKVVWEDDVHGTALRFYDHFKLPLSCGTLILGWWLLLLVTRLLLNAFAPSSAAASSAWPPCERTLGEEAWAAAEINPIVALWYDKDCLCGTANGTQTAAALSSQLTDGLEPDAILSVVVSGLGLFLLSRLGGIPVPDRPEGIVLYFVWMGIQLMQYITVLLSLLMTAISLFNATNLLDMCARSPATVRWSLILTLGVQPALIAPALVLFLYAYSFSTGLKVWSATKRGQQPARAGGNKDSVDRKALIAQLKDTRSPQEVAVASFHYWLAYSFLAWSGGGLLLSAAIFPAALFVPAGALIVITVRGMYWLSGPVEQLLPAADKCYGVDFGAGLTNWMNELRLSSFAPGGFSLRATLSSPYTMVSNRDDPALATLGLSLGVFWLLLAVAVPVCYGTWLTLPLLLGGAKAAEIGEAAIALGSSLLNSLSALIALDWRWPELLDVEAILAFVQQPIASLEEVMGYILDLAWYLNMSYVQLLEGADLLLCLNSVLALIKPVATATAKATPVLTRLLTNAGKEQVGAIGFSECVPSELEGFLAKVGQATGDVEELDLSSKSLVATDMDVVAKLLKTNTMLRTVKLDQNRLAFPEGAESLGSALKVNETLTSIRYALPLALLAVRPM